MNDGAGSPILGMVATAFRGVAFSDIVVPLGGGKCSTSHKSIPQGGLFPGV